MWLGHCHLGNLCRGCWMMDVGSITTTTQIILDINWCTTLLIPVIQSAHIRLEVILEPCRSGLLCTNLLTDCTAPSQLANSTVFQVWGLRSRYDWRSASMSWRPAHLGTCEQILILSEFCCLVCVGRPLWREVGVCLLTVTVRKKCPSSRFIFCLLLSFSSFHFMYIQYMQGLVSPGSIQQIMLHNL
jgi:hypothetical protein